MTSAMLNIRVVQPRMLSLKQASDYVGLPVKRFPAACSVSPVAMPGNIELYDVRDLDAWLDQIKRGSTDHDDAILNLLDKKAG
jgi:hypothetical protein